MRRIEGGRGANSWKGKEKQLIFQNKMHWIFEREMSRFSSLARSLSSGFSLRKQLSLEKTPLSKPSVRLSVCLFVHVYLLGSFKHTHFFFP